MLENRNIAIFTSDVSFLRGNILNVNDTMVADRK